MINNNSNIIYKKYNPQIIKFLKKYYKIVNKENINEIRNDIFIKLYTNYNNLPKEENEISKYIYITCKNHIINYNKKKQREDNIEYTDNEEFIENIAEKVNNVEIDYINDEYIKYILSKMTTINRDIINYKNMGYNVDEISKKISISKSHIYRIINNIRHHENI